MRLRKNHLRTPSRGEQAPRGTDRQRQHRRPVEASLSDRHKGAEERARGGTKVDGELGVAQHRRGGRRGGGRGPRRGRGRGRGRSSTVSPRRILRPHKATGAG